MHLSKCTVSSVKIRCEFPNSELSISIDLWVWCVFCAGCCWWLPQISGTSQVYAVRSAGYSYGAAAKIWQCLMHTLYSRSNIRGFRKDHVASLGAIIMADLWMGGRGKLCACAPMRARSSRRSRLGNSECWLGAHSPPDFSKPYGSHFCSYSKIFIQ